MEIKKVVVPVDFGKISSQLIDYALNLAQQFSADINFCHVVEPSVIVSAGSPDFEEFEYMRRSYGLERMANLIENSKSINRNCKGEVLVGDIVDEIVKYAKDENADLIVIGTHGAKGLEKLLLGSVAERVVKRSDCPCLVMNPYKHATGSINWQSTP